jgi:hemerythrin-like domain-containing protein
MIVTDNPLDMIYQEHEQQERVCAQLEQIADDLPDQVDGNIVAEVSVYLKQELAVHIRDEEDGLFPLLAKRAMPEDNVGVILAQLQQEHMTDEGYACELSDALEEIARGERPKDPNALGHMLRACFESHRRHLAWENAVVLPLAKKRFTSDDLDELAQVMQKNRDNSKLTRTMGVV